MFFFYGSKNNQHKNRLRSAGVQSSPNPIEVQRAVLTDAVVMATFSNNVAKGRSPSDAKHGKPHALFLFILVVFPQ